MKTALKDGSKKTEWLGTSGLKDCCVLNFLGFFFFSLIFSTGFWRSYQPRNAMWTEKKKKGPRKVHSFWPKDRKGAV